MSKLLLIRHGQASLHKDDYDQLSELGIRQSEILGQHLAAIGCKPDKVFTGTLQRHQQTWAAMHKHLPFPHKPVQDYRWDEFDFKRVCKAYLEQFPEQQPSDFKAASFFSLLRKALKAWSEGRLKADLPETWQEFSSRTKDALGKVIGKPDEHETVLVITSGGAISMTLLHLLDLSPGAMIKLNLQTRNTGVTECFFNAKGCFLSGFNSVSHLESIDNQSLITHA